MRRFHHVLYIQLFNYISVTSYFTSAIQNPAALLLWRQQLLQAGKLDEENYPIINKYTKYQEEMSNYLPFCKQYIVLVNIFVLWNRI